MPKNTERKCTDCPSIIPYIPRRIRCTECYMKYTNFKKTIEQIEFIADD